MPVCERCQVVKVPRKSGLCPTCLGELADEMAAQEDKERSLAESWLKDGISSDEAKRIVKDSPNIARIMASKEFKSVLADKHATVELRKLFIGVRSQLALRELYKYARRAIKRKRGRKPKDGEFLYVTVYNLRKSGLSSGKIAKKLWKNSSKSGLARAHYKRALNRGFPAIQPPRNNE